MADDAVERLAEGLAAAGFVAKGDEWARFRDCAVESVDVVPASSWRLPADETARLFADATPLAGHEHLAQLAPADELLVLARRLGGGRTAPAAKHRARIAAALDRDPGAWDDAAGAGPHVAGAAAAAMAAASVRVGRRAGRAHAA